MPTRITAPEVTRVTPHQARCGIFHAPNIRDFVTRRRDDETRALPAIEALPVPEPAFGHSRARMAVIRETIDLVGTTSPP